MSKTNIAVFPDIHIEGRLRTGEKEFENDITNALHASVESLKRWSEENGSIHAVILPGDVYDRKVTAGKGLHDLKVFAAELEDLDCRVLFTQGNHDLNKEYPLCDISGFSHLKSDVPFQIRQGETRVRIYGWDYDDYTWKETDLKHDENHINIGVVHAGFAHLLGFQSAAQASVEDIPACFGAFISGHVHIYSEEYTEHGGLFLSPGSLQPGEKDDLEDKGVVILSVDQTGVSTERLLVPRRTFHEIEVGEEKELDELEALCLDAEPVQGDGYSLKPVFFVTCSTEFYSRVSLLEYRHRDSVFFDVNTYRKSAIEDSFSIDSSRPVEAAVSLLDAVDAVVDKAQNPVKYNLVRDLCRVMDGNYEELLETVYRKLTEDPVEEKEEPEFDFGDVL